MRLTLLLVLFSFYGCKNKNAILKFTVTNQASYDRLDEGVNIPIKDIFRGAQLISKNLALYENGILIPSQFIDKNGDGEIDELYFNIDLKKGVTKELNLAYIDEGLLVDTFVKQRSNVRFGEKKPPHKEINAYERVKSDAKEKASDLFVMEGPAWENDNVAFRNYYDARNGMDIFGKRTTEMVLDNVGKPGSNYHELANWGMDILKVGNSLGAGAIALRTKDTIYRIGQSSKSSYQLITDGPLKSILEFDHKNWLSSGQNYGINHQISIAGGNHYYESSIIANGVRAGDQLVTGIVNLHSDSLYVYDMDDYVVLATYDKQSENGANLGMALVIDKISFVGVLPVNSPSDGISNTYYAALKLSNNKSVKYRFYVGWETQDQKFSTIDGFLSMIKSDIRDLKNPIKVYIQADI